MTGTCLARPSRWQERVTSPIEQRRGAYSPPAAGGSRHTPGVRLNEVKKSFIILVMMGMIAATQSGCMCVYAVRTGGTHLRYLKPTGVWTNTTGEVVVECAIFDKWVLSDESRNLGKRLVCASPATWKSKVEAVVAKRYRIADKIDYVLPIRLDVTLSVTNAADVFAGGFVLFPSEIMTLNDAEPPTSGWVRCGISKNASYPSWPINIDGQVFTIRVDQVSLPQEARKYKDWWWYPNQVLLIPALAVDIVTSPIQFLMGMHSLSKIGG